VAEVQPGAGADLEHAAAGLPHERAAARGEAGALGEPEERVVEDGGEALPGRHALPDGAAPPRIPQSGISPSP
jgi:hypothetical protein